MITLCSKIMIGTFRNMKCLNEAKKDGFCMIHHPDKVTERRAKSVKKWAKDREASLPVGYEKLKTENEKYRKALDKLARLGNEPDYGNSTANCIAREALKDY